MKALRSLAASVAMSAVAIFIAGCEADNSNAPVFEGSNAVPVVVDTNYSATIYITPASAYIPSGQIAAVTFTASGGNSNYTWRLSSAWLGSIYPTRETCIYHSTVNLGTNLITVSDSAGISVSAKIIQAR
jgi:hypothetical protein